MGYKYIYKTNAGYLLRPEMFKNLNGGKPLNKFQMRILGIKKFKFKKWHLYSNIQNITKSLGEEEEVSLRPQAPSRKQQAASLKLQA